MSAVITGDRRPEIVATIRFDGLVGLLRFVICASQIAIHQSREKLIAFDGYNRWHSYFHLAAILVCGVDDRFGGNLRLIDWRHWLWLARQTALHPTELRRIHGRQLDHRHPHVAFVMQ